jgi:hypothetical protein
LRYSRNTEKTYLNPVGESREPFRGITLELSLDNEGRRLGSGNGMIVFGNYVKEEKGAEWMGKSPHLKDPGEN